MKQFPSFSQWKQIFKVLKKGEKISLLVFFVLAITSLGFLTANFYFSNTKLVPTLGGTYVEGIVGQPRFINPIYGETNDIDRTLMDLVFSGLENYDKNGKIVNDLAESYKISTDGKVYDFILKDNIFWHDGRPLTANDIVFTIKTIQNSDYKSLLRANWVDVDVQKISDKAVRFILRGAYNSFLENLTVKILPKHIWENIAPENFTTSPYNLQPIGSGPYQFSSLNQDNTGFIKSFGLVSNRKYYAKSSFIANLSFKFFERKEDLIGAINNGQVSGFTLASLENDEASVQKQINPGWFKNTNFSIYSFSLPRYFAVFFNNQKASLFSDINIRQAISYATNKNELVEKINTKTRDNVIVDSPILPEFFGYQKPIASYNFDINKAKTLLDKSGFKENAVGLREKSITKKPAFQFKSYLKIGSKGNEVIQLQACLVKLDDIFKTILSTEANGIYGKSTEDAVTEFQKKYLPDAKPTGETGAGSRAKLNMLCAGPTLNTQLLKFTLTTINQPQLLEIANMLKSYWQAVGVEVTINALSITDIKPIIKNRSYEALLSGEALGMLPDFYPFWHSSQKIDPGLNLSSYENKDVDKLLKNARETMDSTVKEKDLIKLQELIIKDAPALFLYNPDYIYWVSNLVHGVDTDLLTGQPAKIIDPAKRFLNVTNWFIKTKRVWK